MACPRLDTRSFPTTGDGYRQLLAWARSFGRLRRAGVECTGSYGAGLTRYLHSEGITVTEVNQPDKATRRRRGKTDAIDAAAAAQAVLSGRATVTAKTGDGPVEAIRMFKMAKRSAITSRSQAMNQLKAVLASAEPTLREALTGLSNPKLIRRCLEPEAADGITPAAAAHHTLRLLASRIHHLTEEINDLTTRITTAIAACAPKLLDRYGVGPDTAAALLIPVRMGSAAERRRSRSAGAPPFAEPVGDVGGGRGGVLADESEVVARRGEGGGDVGKSGLPGVRSRVRPRRDREGLRCL
ncbi:transposase [Streptomyces sp. NPDC020096]